MKRIRGNDLIGDLIGRLGDGFRLDCFAHGVPMGGCNGVDHRIIGNLAEKPFLQDFIDLVARQLDRRDRARLPIGFLLEIPDGFAEIFGRLLVTAGEIGDHDTKPRQLERGGKEVRQRIRRDVLECSATDWTGNCIVEIRGQFVQQDQGRLVADKFDPIFVGRSLCPVLPEGSKFLFLADLVGNIPPQKYVRGDTSAIDRRDLCGGEIQIGRDVVWDFVS